MITLISSTHVLSCSNPFIPQLDTGLIDEDQEEGLEVDAMAAQFGVKSGEEKREADAAALVAEGEEGKKVKFDLPEEEEKEEKVEEMKNPDLESSSESGIFKPTFFTLKNAISNRFRSLTVYLTLSRRLDHD